MEGTSCLHCSGGAGTITAGRPCSVEEPLCFVFFSPAAPLSDGINKAVFLQGRQQACVAKSSEIPPPSHEHGRTMDERPLSLVLLSLLSVCLLSGSGPTGRCTGLHLDPRRNVRIIIATGSCSGTLRVEPESRYCADTQMSAGLVQTAQTWN